MSLEGLAGTLTTHSNPQLAPLTNLRMLALMQNSTEILALDPAVLVGMTQLQFLTLAYTQLIGGAVGATALLAVLQGMQQLTLLQLPAVLTHFVEVTPPAWLTGSHDAAARQAAAAAAAAELYAALADSPKLQTLHLVGAVLPPGAWQHMFGPNRHLPSLKSISVSVDADAVQGGPAAFMASEDLANLAQCCPSLEQLGLGAAAMQDGVYLTPRLQLTGLAELSVHGVQHQADADVLVQLTGLRVLCVACQGDAVGPRHLAAYNSLPRCCVFKDRECTLDVNKHEGSQSCTSGMHMDNAVFL